MLQLLLRSYFLKCHGYLAAYDGIRMEPRTSITLGSNALFVRAGERNEPRPHSVAACFMKQTSSEGTLKTGRRLLRFSPIIFSAPFFSLAQQILMRVCPLAEKWATAQSPFSGKCFNNSNLLRNTSAFADPPQMTSAPIRERGRIPLLLWSCISVSEVRSKRFSCY